MLVNMFNDDRRRYVVKEFMAANSPTQINWKKRFFVDATGIWQNRICNTTGLYWWIQESDLAVVGNKIMASANRKIFTLYKESIAWCS